MTTWLEGAMSAADDRELAEGDGTTRRHAREHNAPYMIPAGVPHFDETGRLLLPLREIDFSAYGTAFELEGRSFAPKSEHHITLIGTALATELAAVPGARETIEALIAVWSNPGNWRYRLTTEYRLIGKEPPSEDLSIVVMARLAPAKSLYAALHRALRRAVERPPLHVTLYTAGDSRGISLPTAESLATRRRAKLRHVPPLTEDDGAPPVDENSREPIRCPWCRSVLDCPHHLAQFDITFGECRAGYAWDVFGDFQEIIAARYRQETLARALRARAANDADSEDRAAALSEDDFWPDQYMLTDLALEELDQSGAIAVSAEDDCSPPGFTSAYRVYYAYDTVDCWRRVVELARGWDPPPTPER